MKSILTRLANKQDAALIAEMSRTSFYETFAKDNTVEDMELFMNEQFTTAALIKEVEEEDGWFIIAYHENKPVGYARMRVSHHENELVGANAIEIARLYALTSAIGKGVGSALMQACLELAVNLKKEHIWLGVWEKNERAIAFYQRWHFTKFNEHAFLLGKDLQTDWLMKRPVLLS